MSEKWKIGDIIEGKYKIYKILKGGFGIVFVCLQWTKEGPFPFVIKTFQDKYLNDNDSIQRFILEAETWVKLDKHKNIVRAYYVKKIEGRPYIFLEYVAGHDIYGSSLRNWIYYNAIDIPTAIHFAIQICFGIEHAIKKFKEMNRPFVHRDIKPDNILITHDKVAKITDFGLAKVLPTDDFICGTPQYMPPEQWWVGKTDIDNRADIYSFGCVLYEMLTGRPPFIFDQPIIELYRNYHLSVKPKPPNKFNKDIPNKLNDIVMRCLEKKPEHRYQNFNEIRNELTELYTSLTGKIIKEETPEELEEWELFNKGYSLGNLGMHQEAIVCYDEALKINPKDEKAWVNKGAALAALGMHQEAIVCFDEALKINPKHEVAWNNKGYTFYNLGRYQEAIVCYDEALKINPMYAKTWINKGNALEKLGMYQEAIETYQNFINLVETQEHYRILFGNLIEELKNRIKNLKAQLGKKKNFWQKLFGKE